MKNKKGAARNRNKKTKANFFSKNYSEAWNHIKDSRNFIFFSIAIFFAFSLVSFFLPVPSQISEQILKFIEELIETTNDMDAKSMMGFIFFNNLQSSFMGMAFGIFLGIFPLAVGIINGYILGFVASASVNSSGIFVLWRILPHGIFELPAVFISLGMGLKMGTFIFQKKKFDFLRENFWKSLKAFFLIVVPLLAVAAIIEGTLIVFTG
ncbi:stage II sporulation protein M [Candidatus Pacearchaeota archaeon]|nr:stage II sporulation protein M [Candidatus Pacearchaeota archaeon]